MLYLRDLATAYEDTFGSASPARDVILKAKIGTLLIISLLHEIPHSSLSGSIYDKKMSNSPKELRAGGVGFWRDDPGPLEHRGRDDEPEPLSDDLLFSMKLLYVVLHTSLLRQLPSEVVEFYTDVISNGVTRFKAAAKFTTLPEVIHDASPPDLRSVAAAQIGQNRG
ncbi:hypothetical protein C8J57DRAFT_1513339 [Mycena rebaudengoi]|nr:hypothetical protein C8J57DRAFT_1513339 [Mycena rebaudengoi]